jgi:hypothetical protein
LPIANCLFGCLIEKLSLKNYERNTNICNLGSDHDVLRRVYQK